jgi:alpha-L-rhamnosidase
MKVHETIMSFYDNTNHTFGNGTHDSLALAFKIFDDPSEQKKLARSLAGYYKANGHRWDGGFLSYEVYPQLSRYGYVDDALEILLNTDSPGPAQSVKDFDATTYYETYWHTWLQKLVGQNFIAFTHSAGWMVTDLAGIRYQTPASSRTQLTLEPHFAKDLDFVESSVELPTGIVKSGWQRKNGMISWKVTVPANTETVVKLSQTDIANVTINGQSLKDAGVDTLSNQGIMTFTIKPGIWEIVLPSFK